MDNDKLKIRLGLPTCPLPLLEIDRKDESYYRMAAEAVPVILARYQEIYKELPKDAHYHMAMIHFAANMFSLKDKNETGPYKDNIKEAIRKIEDTLGV